MRYFIVAYDKNRVIGGNNRLLWQGEMKADMARFKELTTGNVVVMGRKTFDSIGKALPNRQNIVITSQKLNIDNVCIAGSLDEAYELAEKGKDIYIIGGAQIFDLAIDSVDKILATEIDAEFSGDVYFSRLSEHWIEESRKSYPADEVNKYPYSFVDYARQQ